MCLIWVWVDWIVLRGPDREMWRRVSEGATKDVGKKEERGEKGFWKRAYWGVRLVTGVRYVGWSCQVKNVPVEVDRDYARWYVLAVTFFFDRRAVLMSRPRHVGNLSPAKHSAQLLFSSSTIFSKASPQPRHTARGKISRISSALFLSPAHRSGHGLGTRGRTLFSRTRGSKWRMQRMAS
jgi:hypothetical protein